MKTRPFRARYFLREKFYAVSSLPAHRNSGRVLNESSKFARILNSAGEIFCAGIIFHEVDEFIHEFMQASSRKSKNVYISFKDFFDQPNTRLRASTSRLL